jgi:hypothetical protein
MRTNFFLLSAFAFLAACSNDAEITAPPSRVAGDATARPAAQADVPPGPNASAKPPAAFTKVTAHRSATISIDAINLHATGVNVQCPAGSFAVGGGYEVSGGIDTRVVFNAPLGATGWRVYVITGASAATFAATVLCVQ